MRKFLAALVAVIVIAASGYAFAQYAAGTNYTEAGATRTVIQGSLDVASGGDFDIETGASFKLAGTAVTATAAELNIVDGSSLTVAELDAYGLTTCIADVSTAQSDWVVAPHAGDITSIWTVIDGAIITADAVITLEIGGTLVTGSTITIANSGSAAGDIDSGTGTAANTVAAGGAIEVITSGASGNTVEVCVTMIIDR